MADVSIVIFYYFCCRTTPEGPLYDAERDLLAIANFLVTPAKADAMGPGAWVCHSFCKSFYLMSRITAKVMSRFH